MTGPEQTTVNELAHLTRGFTAELSDFRAEVRAEFASVRSDIRVLQDDKVARDAVNLATAGRVNISWRAIGAAFMGGLAAAGVVMRLAGIG